MLLLPRHQVPPGVSRSLFARLLEHDVRHCRDTEGRPIGEQRVPEYQAVPTELKKCPYPGSRKDHEKPMNVSALRQMSQHWGAITPTLALMAREYRRREGLDALDYYDLWRICFITSSLPAFLVWRRERPVPPDAVPVWAGAVFKVLLGIQGVAGDLAVARAFFRRHPLARLVAGRGLCPFDAAALLDHSEREGELIGAREVCAGPAKLIEEALRALMDRPAEAPGGSPLPEAVVDLDRYYAFARASAALIAGHAAAMLSMRHPGWPRIHLGLGGGGEAAALDRALEEGLERMRGQHRGEVSWLCQNMEKHGPGVVRAFLDEVRTREPPFRDALGSPASLPPREALRGHARALVERMREPLPASSPGRRERAVLELLLRLVAYLRQERAFLRAFGALAAALESALGVEAAEAPSARELAEVTGATPAGVLEALLPGVSAHNHAGGTLLRCGEWTADLSPLTGAA